MWRASQPVWPGGDTTASALTTEHVELGMLNIRRLATYLAWAGDRVVGWCDLVVDWGEPEHAYVHILSADPEYHKLGIGRKLLRSVFDKTMELGFRRLYLDTWAGNRRAMPLYKKMGFFWVPGTFVKMYNFLPTVLRSPAIADFMQGVDWYSALRQPTQMVEDDHKVQGRPIYTYRFERDGRDLRAVIDRASGEMLAVEGPGYSVGLAVPTQVVIGERALAQCRFSADGTSTVGSGAVWIDGVLEAQRRIVPAEARSAEAVFDLDLKAEGKGSGNVRAELLVGGFPLHLAAGVEAVAPLAVSTQERFWPVGVGETARFLVDVQNNSERSQVANLRALHDDALEVSVEGAPSDVQPDKKRSFAVVVRARRAGAHWLRLDPYTAGAESRSGGASVTVASPGFGEVVAYQRGDEAVLESERARVTMDKTTGIISVYDGRADGRLVTLHARVGPPFLPPYAWKTGGEVSLSANGAAPELRHVMPLPEPAGVTVERRLSLEAGDRLRLSVVLHNSSTEQVSPTYRLQVKDEAPGKRVAIPLKDRLVYAPVVGFPDWSEGDVGPDEFGESWIAREYANRVLGLHWKRFDRIVVRDGFHSTVLCSECGPIPPGSSCEADPIELWVGVGDWRSARAQWYSTPAENMETVGVLRLEPRPSSIVLGSDEQKIDLALAGEAFQTAQPELIATATDGLVANVNDAESAEVSRGQPAAFSLSVGSTTDEASIGALSLRASTHFAEATREIPVIRVKSWPRACKVTETEDRGRPVVSIDNGWTILRVAPDFAGAVVGWDLYGKNHLYTSFPTPDVMAWFGPWYGGIGPAIGTPDQYFVPGQVGLLERDPMRWELLPEARRGERVWSGVKLCTRSSALPWLGVEVEYLTLPGSNLLLATLRLTNSGASAETIRAGLNAYVNPGGARIPATLHWSADHAPHVVPFYQTFDKRGGCWAAVEGADAAIAAVALTPKTSVEGYVLGEYGADLMVVSVPRIESGGAFESTTLFALTRDGAEARRVALLAGNRDL